MTHPSKNPTGAKHAPAPHGSTHRESTVYIDEVTRTATASTQWLLEGADEDGTHPITAHNVIRLLMFGEEAFATIATDLGRAQASVDLVCWGFDPGMELVRKPGSWPRGETFGGLLRRIATRAKNPVKVRLLIWYSAIGSSVMKNMPGYTDSVVPRIIDLPGILHLEFLKQPAPNRPPPPPPTVSELRVAHCVDWWAWALDPANQDQIEVVKREADGDAITALIAKEKNQPSFSSPLDEKNLLQAHGSHHQKTILIDYMHDEGANAIGYVMGLNSLTGYWDTRRHRFNDPLRERQQDAPPGTSVTEVVERVKKAGGDTTDVRVDPLHDYACRIKGQALQCLQRNFHGGWLRARGTSWNDETQLPTRLVDADAFARGSRLQIIRTQPEDKDQTVRDMYFHATSQATNYLYLENQYFQYTEWAEHLIICRKRHRAFYQKVAPTSAPTAPDVLHVFVVIPKPEKAGMVPRTFDTLKVLGRSDLMHELDGTGQPQGQWVEMMPERDALREWDARHPRTTQSRREFDLTQRPAVESQKAKLVDPRPFNKYGERLNQSDVGGTAARINEPTLEQLEAVGVRVLVAMLESYDDGLSGLKGKYYKDKYRQIYIHSKLLIIDDAFFTLGSANLNQRSMAADSEINVATDDPVQARKLREDVWGQHTGGRHDGGNGDSSVIEETFKQWEKTMLTNDFNKTKGFALNGFISTFHDSKTSLVRRA
jgi:phosphatidylserine/phosphatidylglycerophosphate/cardiolipin synthase-like enzyme